MSERDGVVDLLAIARAVPFEYQHTTREFLFETEKVTPDDIPQYGYPHCVENVVVSDIEQWAASRSFLIARNPISTTVGREAIESVWSDTLGSEVREVMADVLSEQLGTIKTTEKNRWLAIGSFGVEKIQAGEVFVQTVGMCACLGVDYTVHDHWRQHGFSEYTHHNIDNRAQRASVLAGLGHIAYTANRYLLQ